MDSQPTFQPSPNGLRILYIAPMNYGWYGLYRQRSLERLGHTVFPIDIMEYEKQGNPWMARIRYRLQIGRVVKQMNADVLRLAKEHCVDVVWFDKPLFIRAETLRQLRSMGIVTVDYMIDNPFGPRHDPGFRLYVHNISEFDLHVQQRDVSVEAYLARDARRVVKVQTAFEPSVHFPPPAGWSDKDRTREVSFIGTPYDERPQFLTDLWRKYDLPVVISGPRIWTRKLEPAALAALYPEPDELYDAAYREGIWRSKINLSFLTHGNQDEYAHKSFEIAACGGFLLAERSAGHSERFRENEEAVFFSDIEECAEKVRRYLNDEPARARIAAAGRRRAVMCGYDNDSQLARVLDVVEELLPKIRAGKIGEMIVDFERDRTLPPFVADVCIVGAGAAGIVLAAQLMRKGKRVLLLESGGRKEDEAFQRLNCSDRIGQPLKSVHAGRFRALGGTTVRWGGQIQEMQEHDFERRPGIAGSGWPISKSELTPYYEQALAAEGLLPVLRTDEEVWRRAGSAAPNLSEDLISYFTRWCPEPNFACLYRDALASTNICVVLHGTVCELMLNEAADAVLGLRCRNLAGADHVFHAPTYVLSMGMLETIQLLLQPLEKGQAPWQKNDWLGQHVQSHIDYNSAKLVNVDRRRMEQVFPNVYLKGRKYQPKLRVTEERQREDGTLNIAGAISFISLGGVERDVRQMKSAARNLLRGNWSAISVRDTLPVVRRLHILMQLAYSFYVSHRAYWPQDVTYWLRVHCEQEPLSASRITLLPQRDAIGMFRSRIDWQVSPLEWKTINRFTQMAQRALENAGLAKLEPQPELSQEDGYRGVTFDDSYHWMGGTRMSALAADGVVDTNLKLHGVRNAYVCSASVYPTSGFANPVHTLLALTIRLADHLSERPLVIKEQLDTQVRADA